MPLASSERNFSDFNLLLTRVIIFLVKCLSCYTCTSEDSLQNCNLKSTKKDCPSGTPNCVTGTLICSAGEVTKTVFYKRCGTKGEDCDPSGYPSCPSSQGDGHSALQTNVALVTTVTLAHVIRSTAHLQECLFCWPSWGSPTFKHFIS